MDLQGAQSQKQGQEEQRTLKQLGSVSPNGERGLGSALGDFG